MRISSSALDHDNGKPGDGGFARNPVQLPSGAPVANLDPADVGVMPDIRYSLDGSGPKVTSNGWAKEATVHRFPLSKGDRGCPHVSGPGRVT